MRVQVLLGKLGEKVGICEFLPRFSSPFPIVALLKTRAGNRRHTAATTETTGCGPASHRAFDWQPRYRLRSAV
jgi:hypothetical protein